MPGAGMRCGAHMKVEGDIENNAGDIEKLFKLVGDKVSMGVFKWIVGMIFFCILGLLAFQGAILNKVSAVDKAVAVIQTEVRSVQRMLRVDRRNNRDSR